MTAVVARVVRLVLLVALLLLTSTGAQSFQYDAANQLTQITSGGTTSNLGYDAGGQLQNLTPTSGGGTRYSYDGVGARTQQLDSTGLTVLQSYGYDQAQRLTSYGSSATYRYDGSGLRTSKTVGGVAEGFVYDIAEGLPVIIQDGSTKYVTGLHGLPLEQVSGSQVRYYHQDRQGTTRALTDQNGNVAATAAYDAYGKLASGSATQPFGYNGQYTDAESGLQYLRARYYDPATAQFLTRDPAVAVTGLPYAYTGGSPLLRSDPSGLISLGDVGLALVNGVISVMSTGGDPCTAYTQISASVGKFLTIGFLIASIILTDGADAPFVGMALEEEVGTEAVASLSGELADVGAMEGAGGLEAAITEGAGAAEDASVGLSFTERQLQSQLAQHGGEWGFGGVANTAANREAFLSRLVDHIDAPGTTRIEGTFRGQNVIHYVNDQGLNVFTTPEGGFWGAWRLNPDQLWNVLTRGSL